MKTTLFSAFLIVGTVAAAQPVINMNDLNPPVGTSYSMHEFEYVSPGNAGANQTWDLSGVQSDFEYPLTFALPAGQPGSDLFENATHTVISGDDTYSYLKYTSNEIQVIGEYLPEGFVLSYSAPRTLYSFPLEFNDQFSDSWSASMDLGDNMTASDEGTVTATVDGYGTLITPAGTFTNVLRIKYESASVLSVWMGAQVINSIETTETTYSFVKSGYGMNLASLTSAVIDGETEEYGEYLTGSGSTVGLPEVEEGDFTIFPSPAVDQITVGQNDLSGNWSIFSLQGRLIAQGVANKGEKLVIDLPKVSAGIYIFQVQNETGVFSKKFAVQR